jgi:hypothetical protein
VISKFIYEIGAEWLEPFVGRRLVAALKGRHYDLIWSDQCNLIGAKTAGSLKQFAPFLITYAVDDPFGTRDKRRFSLYRKGLRCYDLMAVVREPNVKEAYAAGVSKVVCVYMSADEVAHAPLALSPQDHERWGSDVAFVGTWMRERGPFMARLLELGVPLSIWGDRWQKAPEWPRIRKVWRGPGIHGPDYVKAIQCAKVCLGLLSKGNRDLHTTRSAEVPYIGSVLCAERTSEHLAMYKEDEEAVFWDTPEECAEKCFALLADDEGRRRIAQAGRKRCIESGYLNEPVIESVLNALPTARYPH